MPFTLSHPAAILPIHRWTRARLPLSALIVGSMSPDFAYFVPLGFSYLSHNLLGILYFCLPVGFVVWSVFEFLLRRPTLLLLPDALRARIPEKNIAMNWPFLIMIAVALMLGALTHVVWDAFTHARPPFVTTYQIFMTVIVELRGKPVYLYKFLQHASTAAGMLILAYAALSWWRKGASESLPTPVASNVRTRWKVAAISAIVFASLAGAAFNFSLHLGGSIERQLYHFCIGGMAGCAIAWCLVAIFFRLTLLSPAAPQRI